MMTRPTAKITIVILIKTNLDGGKAIGPFDSSKKINPRFQERNVKDNDLTD
jgi:hypothetical protein